MPWPRISSRQKDEEQREECVCGSRQWHRAVTEPECDHPAPESRANGVAEIECPDVHRRGEVRSLHCRLHDARLQRRDDREGRRAPKEDDVEAIAAHFMTTPAVVRQRLKLASVAPALHDLYAEDEMTLDQLMAFTVSDDPERQVQTWELLAHSFNKSPAFIRSKRTENSVRAVDKRVRFVSVDAYVSAGGSLVRDLFEADDGGWLTDPALLDRLVSEKLAAIAERIGAEGWKWVEALADFPHGATRGLRWPIGHKSSTTPRWRSPAPSSPSTMTGRSGSTAVSCGPKMSRLPRRKRLRMPPCAGSKPAAPASRILEDSAENKGLPVRIEVCHLDGPSQFWTGLDINCIPICYLLF